MSVKSVNLRSQQSGLKQDELTATLVYVVVVDDPDDNSETARLICPGIGSLFENSTARCVSSTAAMFNSDPSVFEVTLEFSSKFDPASAGDPNPLLRPPRISYGGSNISVPFFRDKSPAPTGWTGYGAMGTDPPPPGQDPKPWLGKRVVNSARDNFADLPTRFQTQGSITIVRNEPSYNDAIAETWRSTVNSDEVTINGTTYTRAQLLMSDISSERPASETFTNNLGVLQTVTYWSVSYVIQKKVDTWDLNIDDLGLNELWKSGDPAVPDKQFPILDRYGLPVTLPFPLDGNGSSVFSPTYEPAVLTFKPYTEREWSGHNFV